MLFIVKSGHGEAVANVLHRHKDHFRSAERVAVLAVGEVQEIEVLQGKKLFGEAVVALHNFPLPEHIRNDIFAAESEVEEKSAR